MIRRAGRINAAINMHSDSIKSLAFGDLLASGGGDKRIGLRDLSRSYTRLSGHRNPINRVTFASGRLLISSSTDRIILREIDKILGIIEGYGITDVATDGKNIAYSIGYRSYLVNIDEILGNISKEIYKSVIKVDEPLHSLSFSPRGDLLAAGGRNIYLIDPHDLSYISIGVKDKAIIGLEFSPRGDLLASNNGTIYLWDLSDGIPKPAGVIECPESYRPSHFSEGID